MHLLWADSHVGVKTMYNLVVAQDHTFVVGIEQWVVHNDCGPSADIGQARENYVQDNLSTLVSDDGSNLQPQVKLSVEGASTRADFMTDTGIYEVGGYSKSFNLDRIAKQFSVNAKVAQQTGRQAYFLYDMSGGSLPASIQRLADRWGVTVVQFSLPVPIYSVPEA